jgi:hypothetical protein
MSERQLRAVLRETPLPDARAGEERAWRIVRASHAEQRVGRRARRAPRAGLAAICALALAALALATTSQPREALARWFRQAIGATTRPARPVALSGLPPGELLLSTDGGQWLVTGGGARWHVASFAGAALSPHGLYVLGWRGSVAEVVNPHGAPQWWLRAPAPVSLARWSADGYRVAYVAGNSLRIVAGDGSGDRDLVDGVSSVAPAWRPVVASTHELALLDSAGFIQVRDADTGALVWRTRTRALPRQLLWAPDGRTLVAVAGGRLTLYGADGRRLASWTPPAGQALGPAAFAPRGDQLALVTHSRAPLLDGVETVKANRSGLRRPPRVLLSAAEQITGLAWSPNGSWLLAPSPSAGQWDLIRASGPVSLRSISRVQARIGSRTFPAVAGWQP